VWILWILPASHLQSSTTPVLSTKDTLNKGGERSWRVDVDGRCDGEWDECQRSESRNKLLRQSEGRCVAL